MFEIEPPFIEPLSDKNLQIKTRGEQVNPGVLSYNYISMYSLG